MNKRTAAALDDLAGCIVIAIRELGLNDLQHPKCVFRLLEAREELARSLKTEELDPWPKTGQSGISFMMPKEHQL